MALAQSPSIVTSGLVFYYDMGNSQKSWRGRPVVNQFALPEVDVNGFSVQNSTFTRIRTGTFAGYDIQPTDYVWRYNISVNDCPYHGNDVTINAGQTATFSFDYYVDPSTSNYVVTNSLAAFEGVVGGGFADPTPSIKGVWKRAVFSATAGSTGLCRMLLYPGACGGRLGDSGFILYRNPQVEFDAPGLAASPFVAGPRLANNNLETTPSFPTWNATAGSSASGGTLTFSGGSYNSKNSWDLYKTYSGLSTGVNYTWSALVRTGTASNLIVTMNNTQSWNTGPSAVFAGLSSTEWTRISITGTTNSGSFNLHLGASFNNEVASTSQSAGTIFIQDVRLFLTQSQTSLTDLIGRTTTAPNNLTYNSDGTFNFIGGDATSTITVPLASSFNKLTGTIGMWVNPSGYSGSNGLFVNRENNTSNATDWFWIGSWDSANVFYFRLGNGSDCCSNDLTISNWASFCPINTWTYVTCSWTSAGTSRIYTNGILRASRSISAIPATNPSATGRIGLGHEAPASWNGKIAVTQIYDRQLTDSEILSNFNSMRGRFNI